MSTVRRAHFFVEFACSFEGVAVVQEQSAVKEKHIAALKIHIFGEEGGVHIAGIRDGYFGVRAHKIGHEGASEGVAEHHKALAVLLRGICYFDQGNGA